jgi:hypothetical protein
MHKHSSGMQSLSWSETADTETWITMPQALIAHTSKRQFAWIGMELVMGSIKQNTYIAGDLIHTQTNKQTKKKKKAKDRLPTCTRLGAPDPNIPGNPQKA